MRTSTPATAAEQASGLQESWSPDLESLTLDECQPPLQEHIVDVDELSSVAAQVTKKKKKKSKSKRSAVRIPLLLFNITAKQTFEFRRLALDMRNTLSMLLSHRLSMKRKKGCTISSESQWCQS